MVCVLTLQKLFLNECIFFGRDGLAKLWMQSLLSFNKLKCLTETRENYNQGHK